MRLSSRTRQLQHAELANVRRALDEAVGAMQSAKEAQRAYFADVPKKDFFAKKKEPEAPPDAANWNLKELKYAWAPSREALEAWLAHGDDVFFPALLTWDGTGGDAALATLQGKLRKRQELAYAFQQTLQALRAQATFVAPVRGPIANLIGAVELVQRAEDVEIVPSILSGQRETSTQATAERAQRYRTSDDVARSLRMARPPELKRMQEEEVPPEPTSFFGKLAGFLKRS